MVMLLGAQHSNIGSVQCETRLNCLVNKYQREANTSKRNDFCRRADRVLAGSI